MVLQEINSFPKETIGAAELEEIIFRLGNLLSNTNWMVLEIQQKLLNVYMQTKMMDRPTKDRKIQLCDNILQYMDRIDPDNAQSQKRQLVKRCLMETMLETLTQDYKKGMVDKSRLAKALTEKQLLMSSEGKHNI